MSSAICPVHLWSKGENQVVIESGLSDNHGQGIFFVSILGPDSPEYAPRFRGQFFRSQLDALTKDLGDWANENGYSKEALAN